MIRAMFQIKAVLLHKKVFSKNFSPDYDSLVGADMDVYKNADEKNILFHRKEKMHKNGQKRTKNGYCVNPP